MNNYCIVSHKYKFIFIPIAKSGCTSLLNRLAEIIHDKDMPVLKTKSHRDVHLKRKALFKTSSSEIMQSSNVATAKYPDYFCFAVVRNPYDRVHSCYVDKLSNSTYGFDKNLINKYPQMSRGMSFAEFLKEVKRIPLEEADEHFRPQYTFLPENAVDFVGKLENIDEDWHTIESRIGIKHNPLPHYNKTEKTNYYDNEAIGLAKEIYAKDFEVLNYDSEYVLKKDNSGALPMDMSPGSEHEIHPFNDVFINKVSGCYEVQVTGKEPRILFPFFRINKGKGVVFNIDIFAPKETVLTLFYSVKSGIDAPEKRFAERKVKEGGNTISIFLTVDDLAGRLRLKPANTLGKYIIKKIRVDERTLPWLEDKSDLSAVNQKLFNLPDYTQNHKNLSSMVNYASLYMPLIEAINPKTICEVGCDLGDNSLMLAKLCDKSGGKLHMVDTVQPDLSQLDRYRDSFEFHRGTSTDYLSEQREVADVYFIDGDHNYQTLSDELRLISELVTTNNKPICMFLHDTFWPCAYRNHYYSDPSLLSVSMEDVVSASDKQLSLYSEIPVDEGFPMMQYNSLSIHEGGEANGVRKAVEDFMSSRSDWCSMELPSLYGLTVIWIPSRLSSAQSAVFERTREYLDGVAPLLSILEWNRLALLSQINLNSAEWKRSHERIENLENQVAFYKKFFPVKTIKKIKRYFSGK